MKSTIFPIRILRPGILVGEGLAVFIDDGHVVSVSVGVDTGDDFGCFGYQDGSCPAPSLISG